MRIAATALSPSSAGRSGPRTPGWVTKPPANRDPPPAPSCAEMGHESADSRVSGTPPPTPETTGAAFRLATQQAAVRLSDDRHRPPATGARYGLTGNSPEAATAALSRRVSPSSICWKADPPGASSHGPRALHPRNRSATQLGQVAPGAWPDSALGPAQHRVPSDGACPRVVGEPAPGLDRCQEKDEAGIEVNRRSPPRGGARMGGATTSPPGGPRPRPDSRHHGATLQAAFDS